MTIFINEKNCSPIHLGNDWGFYVDLENSYSTINNDKIIRKKYNVIFDCDYYYSDIDDYEVTTNDYEINDNDYEINDNYEVNVYKSDLKHSLFHISSVTLITAALTYYVFWII